jgi:hypothetical protein
MWTCVAGVRGISSMSSSVRLLFFTLGDFTGENVVFSFLNLTSL